MSLKEEIERLKKNIPEHLREMICSEAERLDAAGLTTRCLKKGDRAPVFSLPNQAGEIISSAELLKTGPLVVAFYRGGW